MKPEEKAQEKIGKLSNCQAPTLIDIQKEEKW